MKRIIENKSARSGIFIGATSGVITTIGLHAATQSIAAVRRKVLSCGRCGALGQ